MTNLEDYVSLIVDATVRSGISRQVEAFKSGFNQVCAIAHFINNKKKWRERIGAYIINKMHLLKQPFLQRVFCVVVCCMV